MSTFPSVRFLNRTTPPHIATLVLLSGVAAMNMSSFLPSLPKMAAEFGTDYSVMQLSVTLYLVTTAFLQLIIGPISDRFGRRVVTFGCLVIFVAAILGCMLSTNVTAFLVFRMISGTVAGGFVLSRAVVRDMHPADAAASMIGYVTMGMALVPMVAPMIGGALDESFGWRATFVMLALSGIAMIALSWADMGETAPPEEGAGFRKQLSEYPELLTSRRFWGYVACSALASGAFFAFLGGAPYVASDIYGLNAFWAGVGFGAPAIGYALGNFLSGMYSVRVGINRMILIGSLVTVIGMGASVLLSLAGFDSALLFFAFSATVGLGNGITLPSSMAGMLSVRPHLAGSASGLGGAILIGGGAALSSLAGVVLVGATTALPLQILMLLPALLALLVVFYIRNRERQLSEA